LISFTVSFSFFFFLAVNKHLIHLNTSFIGFCLVFSII
jgi:hypothetical protein